MPARALALYRLALRLARQSRVPLGFPAAMTPTASLPPTGARKRASRASGLGRPLGQFCVGAQMGDCPSRHRDAKKARHRDVRNVAAECGTTNRRCDAESGGLVRLRALKPVRH
jgi:hypothetical protein